jgi:hypothetical protein
MRINKTGHDHLAPGIQGRFISVCLAQLFSAPHCSDFFAANEHRTVRNGTQFAQLSPALRAAG